MKSLRVRKEGKESMNRKISCLVVFLVLSAGASSLGVAEDAQTPPVPAAGLGSDYIIGPGDLLNIEVWKDPVLTRQVVVLPDGKIAYPLIGEMAAGGKTVAQLKKEIEQKIARYVPEAFLTVEVRQLNSMHIYVLGRVQAPGRTTLNANINVLQALAIAGGPTPYANRSKIRIFRYEGEKTKVFSFDYDDVTAGKELHTNIELKRGDVVYVP